MEYLSRFELAEIRRMHDEQGYKCINKEHLAEKLAQIGLPPHVSRFEVSERIKELERRI